MGRGGGKPIATARARVLVIDDEESFHDIAAKYLVRHELHSAYNGWSALQALLGSRFDVILLDLNLPDRNGFAIHEDLRAVEPDARVIVISGDDDLLRAARVFKLGAFDFMCKCYEAYRVLDDVVAAAARAGSVAAAAVGADPVATGRDRFVRAGVAAMSKLDARTAELFAARMRRAALQLVLATLGPQRPPEAILDAVRRLPDLIRRTSVRHALALLHNLTLASRVTGVSRPTIREWRHDRPDDDPATD